MMKPNLSIALTIHILLFHFIAQTTVSSYELTKYKQAKPDVHRCAYRQKGSGNKEGEKEKRWRSKWTLIPSATACDDELPVWPPMTASVADGKTKRKTLCEEIFVKEEGDLRPMACDNEWIQPLAKKCRKTCGTCCELPRFLCEDKAHTHSEEKHNFSCYTISDILPKCHSHHVWRPILLDHCASTCGLCEEVKLLEEMKSTKSRKKKEELAEKLREEEEESGEDESFLVPRTEKCANKATDRYCQRVLKQARDADGEYINRCKEQKILRRCMKTCGKCLPLDFKCEDMEGYSRRCKWWAVNGFCRMDGEKVKKYPLQKKLQYCAKTCKLCKNDLEIVDVKKVLAMEKAEEDAKKKEEETKKEAEEEKSKRRQTV